MEIIYNEMEFICCNSFTAHSEKKIQSPKYESRRFQLDCCMGITQTYMFLLL